MEKKRISMESITFMTGRIINGSVPSKLMIELLDIWI